MRCLLLAVLLVATIATTPSAKAQYDRQLFCRPDAAEVMVLIDITSALDDRARQLLEDGVRQIVDSLDPGESIRISTIADQVTTGETLFKDCVPFCPSDLVTILLGNCTEGLLRLENRRLRNQLSSALRAGLAATEDLPHSDILRTLKAATAARQPGRPLKLFVFSDLIENSTLIPAQQFWASSPDELVAQSIRNGLLPQLADSQVHVFGIGRGGSGPRDALPQARAIHLQKFWSSFFLAAGSAAPVLSETLTLH